MKAMSESVEIANVWLGLTPYVLLEPKLDDDGDVAISIKAGGGIANRGEMKMFLEAALVALEELEDDDEE